MTQTINNTNHHEKPTRLTTVKTETVDDIYNNAKWPNS